MFAHLFLKITSKIFILTQLHYDVELVAGLERIIELNDVFILKLIHQERLLQGFFLLSSPHATEVDLLKHIDLLILLVDDSIDYTKGTLSKLILDLKLSQAISHSFY